MSPNEIKVGAAEYQCQSIYLHCRYGWPGCLWLRCYQRIGVSKVAAATLLALWLSGLRVGVDARVPHLVLVLDDTASMAARGSGGERTAAESARREVGELVDDLPYDGVATVIRTGWRPGVLQLPRPLGHFSR